MARTDAVQFFLELAAEWRRLGAEVTFEPGWERRGNGTSPAYEGGVVHHTGFVSSFANPFPALGTLLNGRPDLRGPLANVGGPVCPLDRPRLHIIAAFPANHAGASGGRSMGPLPVSSLFNRLVVGLEIDYAGLTPMIGGQYRAGLIFARGLSNVLRRSTEYVRAHGETSITGKWDIGVGNGRAQTYDMAAFRRDAAAITSAPKPTPVPELGDLDMHVLRDPNSSILLWTPISLYPIGSQVLSGAAQKILKTGVTDVTWAELDALAADVKVRRNELALSTWAYVGADGGVDAYQRLNDIKTKALHVESLVAQLGEDGIPGGVSVGPDDLAAALARPEVAAAIGDALADKVGGAGPDEIKAAVVEVLRQGTDHAA